MAQLQSSQTGHGAGSATPDPWELPSLKEELDAELRGKSKFDLCLGKYLLL